MDRYRGDLISDSTRRFLARPKRMLIGGEWVEAIDGGRTRLATETRIAATDAGAARRFRVSWAFVRPGSGLIRRVFLRAVRAGPRPRPRPNGTSDPLTLLRSQA